MRLCVFLFMLLLFGCQTNVNNTQNEYIKFVPKISDVAQLTLNYHFVPELSTERMLCLYGDIGNNGMISINEVYFPVQLNSTESYIFTKSCPLYYNKNFLLGTIHNHPNSNCIPSSFDVQERVKSWLYLNYTYNYTKRIIEGIVCGEVYNYYIVNV